MYHFAPGTDAVAAPDSQTDSDPLVLEQVTPGHQRRFFRLPTATYRVQLRKDRALADVEQLLDYFSQLGISDLYLSPLFRAREQSSHGYDVVNHAEIAQDFGGRSGFDALAGAARQHGMGILLDIVPNHMGINDPRNSWWNDVLKNGPRARYAAYFDIDWDRPAQTLNQRVLLPVLGKPFGTELESSAIGLVYETAEFWITYGSMRFPVTPLSWPMILQLAVEDLRREHVQESRPLAELCSIVTQLTHLLLHEGGTAVVGTPIDERYREQAIAARRLSRLVDQSSEVAQALHKAVEAFNEHQGVEVVHESDSNSKTQADSSGFQPARHPVREWRLLEALLEAQWYRLAYWRVAADEINYRRFFDINDLAAVRVERPEVFEQVHALIAELLAAGQIHGLRVDHVDGLLDPGLYLEELQRLARRSWAHSSLPDIAADHDRELFVVVEKILSGEEKLPSDWRVAGTTGYDLLVDVNLLQIEAKGLDELRTRYAALTEQAQPREVVYHSKLRIIDNAMSSELHMLANQLHRLSQQTRWGRDFTFSGLLRGLREIVASFPVYRTYIRSRGWEAGQEDHAVVMQAVRMAKRRNPTMERSVFDFLAKVLLLQYPPGLETEIQEELRAFVLRCQQVTGPITAKGTEDTAGYRYYPLASINEVGSELDAEAVTVDEFHRRMQRRAADWPHALSATATHDTKRGEDVRARLNVLSEEPTLFLQQFDNWRQENRDALTHLGTHVVPGTNEQYLLFQTLVGTWPWGDVPDGDDWAEYEQRISSYMLKAVREAKQHTSWASPVEEYEQALLKYIHASLSSEGNSPRTAPVQRIVSKIADSGYLNSLTQTMLKMTVPGIPDLYQGTEFWDMRLVDPDNRRPVDFASRLTSLRELQERFAADAASLHGELWRQWPAAKIKQFLILRMLQLRQTVREAFEQATYLPLETMGKLSEHLLAFARIGGGQVALVGVALRTHRVRHTNGNSGPVIDWHDTAILLPAGFPTQWRDQLSCQVRRIDASAADGARVAISEFFGSWSVACWLAAQSD